MIRLDSSVKLHTNVINKILDTFKFNGLKLNIDSIEYGIKKMDTKKNGNNIFNKNVSLIKEYLRDLKILASNEDSKIDLKFYIENDKIKSKPFETKKIPFFDIETTDFIDVTNKTVINIDYSELIDSIAFEMSYREFGYSLRDVEETLKDVTIIGVNDSKIVKDLKTKWVGNQTAYDIFNCVVSDTSYTNINKEHHTDYFGRVVKNDLNYREMIENTMDYSMCVIVYNILNDIVSNDIDTSDLKLAAVYDSSFVLIADSDKYRNMEAIHKAVGVRLFGRYFKFVPNVTIF